MVCTTRHKRQLFFDYPVRKETTVLLDVEMWNTENVSEQTIRCSGKLFLQLELPVLVFVLLLSDPNSLACTACDIISLNGQGQLKQNLKVETAMSLLNPNKVNRLIV